MRLSHLVFLIVAFALWLGLSSAVDTQHLVAGVVVAILGTIVFGGRFAQDAAKCLQPSRYLWFCVYVPVFLWECLKANLDVAYRVLHPAMPIEPGIVKIPTNLKSDMARTFLANSITMTPGTLSVDLVGDQVYVHWIYVKDTEPTKAAELIAGRFERLLARIFE